MGGLNYYFKYQKRIPPMAVKQRRKPAWIGWLIVTVGIANIAMAFVVIGLVIAIAGLSNKGLI